ncbi:hypothetical protein KEJ27_00895, partial [Candidatus Bathyarchaeota archaeon]|nr:hypothetical protein [Candidatus Bathyarchaeota archaeon]
MKSSISLKTLMSLLALLILLAAPAYAAVITITVTTDKPSYLLGQIVTISGTVKEDNVAKANVYVNIEVRDPVGTLRFADVVKTASDGSFTTSFKIAETLATGTYTVKATYGGVSKTASFTVSAAPTFTITVTPETLVVPIGLSDSANIQVTAVGAYVYEVVLTATTVENLSVSFINATGTPSFSSIAVVTASLEAVKGTYRLTVTATGEDNTTVSKSLTVVVVDTPPAISKLLSELESINETLTGLEKTVKDLKTDVDTVKTSVTGLTSRLLTAETNIDSLLSDVRSLRE